MLTLADSTYWSRKATWDETTTKNGLDSPHDYPMHAAYDHHRHSSFSSDGGEKSVRQLPTLVTRFVRQRVLMFAIFIFFCDSTRAKYTRSRPSRPTQSPPSAWHIAPQSESSAVGQGSAWNQVSPNERPTSPAAQIPPSQPRISFLNETQTRTYELDVVQHPQRTAEFGSATLSRLPLAPPIVVQLTVRDRFGHSFIPEVELPFLIAHLSLFSDDGMRPLDMGTSPTGDTPPRRLLYGNLVSSPQKLRDLSGRQGLYFLFPDVSIRWRGRFQLGVSLLRLSETDASGMMSLASLGTVLATARTRPFEGARIQAFPPNTP
ncbi:velvet factor-domain-containing protein [Scleroderma yunnanense]